MNFKFLQSAFDKLGGQTGLLEEIRDNTEQTAVALNPGGELFDRMDRMVTALENIEQRTAAGKGGLQEAIVLKLVAPTLKPIGLGLGFIVDALEKAGPGKELAEKMDALTKGLVVLGDVGLSILKFAGYMILATPLLLVAAVASIVWVPAIMLMLKGLMFATEGLDEERMKKLVLLGDVGMSVLKLAGSLALVALLAIPALVGLLATTVILVGIAGVFKILDMIGADPKRMEDFGDSIKSLGMGLLLLGGTLALLSVVAMPVLKGLMVAMAVIAGIGLTFFLLDKLGIDKSMRNMAFTLMLVSLSIVTLATALALADILIPPMERTLQIAAVVGGVALVFGLAGLLKSYIIGGALAMIFAGLSLVVIGLGLQMISKPLETGGWEFIGQVGAIVVGLGLAMAAAGAAAMFIAPGAAVMILAGGALVVIGLGLKAIASVDFKALGALANGKGSKAFDWSGEVSEGFLGFGAGRKKTNFEIAMEAVAAGLALGPISIAGIMAGAPTLILASAALIGIAKGLRVFKEVVAEADLPKLSENMDLIVSGLADTFAKVGQKYPGGGGGIMSALFGSGSDTSVVAQGISAVSGMGRALKGIAKGVQAMAELKFPTGFDKDGNPTGYETINLTTAVPALIANTQLIVTGLSKTFAEVGESDAAQGSTWFTSSSYEKGIKVVKKMGEPLYNLANGVQNMANLKFPTGYDKEGNPTGFKSIGNVGSLVKKLTKNTKAIIIGLAGVFEQVGKSDAAKGGGWFSKSNFEKGIEVALQLADPYSALADAVEDVTKITSSVGDAEEVKAKVTAMISSITDAGGSDSALIAGKTMLIGMIGATYEKLGTAIPAIVSAIASFTVDKAKAFAAIFGGESPAELFESKTNYLKGLTMSYMRMAFAIPLIVGSINTVQAEQLDAFTAIYGGKMTDVEMMNSRKELFIAIGDSYEKLGGAVPRITSAISGVEPEAFDRFKGLFIGRVGMLRPIAGYEAQTELWNAIGANMGATATAFPTIAEGINAMDLAKLTETRQMFEALAVLAEGGESPEDILEAMGESLSTALENLTAMIETFRTTVETGTEAQGNFIEEAAGTIGTSIGNFVGGVTGMGGGGNSAAVVSAIETLRRTLTSKGIKIKDLDDLVS